MALASRSSLINNFGLPPKPHLNAIRRNFRAQNITKMLLWPGSTRTLLEELTAFPRALAGFERTAPPGLRWGSLQRFQSPSWI